MTYEQKDGQGALFKNHKKEQESHKDYHGSIKVGGRGLLAFCVDKGVKRRQKVYVSFGKAKMTDYEFWECMAIMVEAAETMPDYGPEDECRGICGIATAAYNLRIIDHEQTVRLYCAIESLRPKNHFTLYFWPIGAWRPRVKAMRKLAAMAAKNGGNHE